VEHRIKKYGIRLFMEVIEYLIKVPDCRDNKKNPVNKQFQKWISGNPMAIAMEPVYLFAIGRKLNFY